VVRVSDDTREQAVARLRQGLLAGRLGTETFVDRVDAAYRAQTHDELAALTDDLPPGRRLWDAIVARLARGRESDRAVPLCPPLMRLGESRVLGRKPSCDYAIADPTVSGRHAELTRTADGWRIKDLSSRNGTRVNGWLVDERALEEGDIVALGAAVFVFRPPGS
jgi:FHA domain/Domain of unknown function (DUF1707)